MTPDSQTKLLIIALELRLASNASQSPFSSSRLIEMAEELESVVGDEGASNTNMPNHINSTAKLR